MQIYINNELLKNINNPANSRQTIRIVEDRPSDEIKLDGYRHSGAEVEDHATSKNVFI